MSRSITVAKLAFAAPDGRILFDGLDLTFRAERAGLVGRNGVGKTTLLRLIAGELLPRAGSVTVGGSIAVLRQAVRPRPGETVADLFGGAAALALLRRAEAGDATVAELAEADWTLPARMDAALGRLGLPGLAPETALTRLSGGQGTRAALAALVFAAPDFLLLDEPTNNLDADGRAAVADLLAGWRGGAIVVSHDRALLETMDAIIELTTLGATRHGGGFSAYRAQKEVALAAAGHDLAEAQKRVALLARTAQQRAERQQRRDGAGARKAAKGDQPRILLGMMKGRAEATGGANVRLTGKRGADAAADAGAAREKIEVLTPFAVSLPPSGLPPGRMVLEMAEVAAGYDPARPVLSGLALTMAGPERVAVTGPNGSGKTTLLALVTGAMEPFAGTVKVGVPFAFLDQRVSLLDPAASIRDNFRRLNPGADDNACRAALARFMFRADAALQAAGTLSGGQLLRAGLACTLGGPAPPQLLILDEPTNHLDLDAIAAVEAGVRAYDGALLVVSHDAAFLEAVGVTRRVALG